MNLICRLYLLVCCLYSLQGVIYERGGVLAHGLLAVLFVVSLICFSALHLRYRLPWVLRTLSVLLVLWTVYGSFILLTGNGVDSVSDSFYLRNIIGSILPVFAFYFFSKKGCLTESRLRKWFFVFIAVCIAQYYAHQDEVLTKLASEGIMRDEITNNSGYLLLSLFPLLPLWNKKPLVQYALWGGCMFYILISAKRGAILIGGICSVWFVINAFKEKSETWKKLWRLLITAVVVVTSIHFFRELLQSNQFLISRIEDVLEGDSSGRNEIIQEYSAFFFQQASMLHFLFGNGADATLRLFEQYAHNDWLEIGINNGVVILFLYFIYWIQLFSNMRKSKFDNICHMMLAMFFLIYFMKSLISMSYNDISFFSACGLGYALARVDNVG